MLFSTPTAQISFNFHHLCKSKSFVKKSIEFLNNQNNKLNNYVIFQNQILKLRRPINYFLLSKTDSPIKIFERKLFLKRLNKIYFKKYIKLKKKKNVLNLKFILILLYIFLIGMVFLFSLNFF